MYRCYRSAINCSFKNDMFNAREGLEKIYYGERALCLYTKDDPLTCPCTCKCTHTFHHRKCPLRSVCMMHIKYLLFINIPVSGGRRTRTGYTAVHRACGGGEYRTAFCIIIPSTCPSSWSPSSTWPLVVLSSSSTFSSGKLTGGLTACGNGTMGQLEVPVSRRLHGNPYLWTRTYISP